MGIRLYIEREREKYAYIYIYSHTHLFTYCILSETHEYTLKTLQRSFENHPWDRNTLDIEKPPGNIKQPDFGHIFLGYPHRPWDIHGCRESNQKSSKTQETSFSSSPCDFEAVCGMMKRGGPVFSCFFFVKPNR